MATGNPSTLPQAEHVTRSIPDVLASSKTLPHDVAGLDAAWREWLKRTQSRRR